MPALMRESELPHLIRTGAVSNIGDDESRLSGHPVSGGCVEAEVVVVHDPSDFSRMKTGAILVAPATDPSWTPLFTLAWRHRGGWRSPVACLNDCSRVRAAGTR
jgi:phosphoenolpyruvate synthase/pyruvate phosphate dikinase